MSPRWRQLHLLLSLVLVLPAPLTGQQADTGTTIQAGDRVRVWSPAAGLRGEEFTLRARTADTLSLSPPRSGDSVRIALPEIEWMEVRTSGGGHFWTGAAIGGGVGMLVNGLSLRWGLGCRNLGCRLLASTGFVLAGGLLGGGVGSGIADFSWRPAEVGPGRRITTDAAISPPGWTVGLTLTLPE